MKPATVRHLFALLCLAEAGALALAFLGSGTPAAGQDPVQLPPNRGGFTTSMGRPPSWRWSLGGSVVTHRRDAKDIAIYVNGGVYHDLLSPVMSALGVLAEGYAGQRGTSPDAATGPTAGFA